MNVRVGAKRVADDDKKEVGKRDDQSHRKTDRSLASMRGHSERHANHGKSQAGKWKRKTFVNLSPAGALLPFVFALELLKQLLDRHGRTIRLMLLAFVKFLEANRQRPFLHIYSIANTPEIERIVLIALLITRIVKMHQNAFVLQVGLEPPTARVSHFYGQRVFVHFENHDVFEIVPLLLTNVNFSAGKFVDYLVAPEKCHRIACCQVEDGIA